MRRDVTVQASRAIGWMLTASFARDKVLGAIGPVGYAPWVTWAIAAVDAFAAYQNRWEYHTRPAAGHPLTKIFR